MTVRVWNPGGYCGILVQRNERLPNLPDSSEVEGAAIGPSILRDVPIVKPLSAEQHAPDAHRKNIAPDVLVITRHLQMYDAPLSHCQGCLVDPHGLVGSRMKPRV